MQSLLQRLILNCGAEKLLIDFWVRYRNQERLFVINRECPFSNTNVELPIQVIAPAELLAARTWITNWERMLPCMIACRSFVTDALLKTIIHFVSQPTPLSRIERELSLNDPALTRAAVFALLHRGQLQAPKLATEPLSYLTLFEPCGEHR
jgi:hypothetical protein